MNSGDVDVLRTAVAWLAGGRRVILATVVQTWGSAPRPPGSLMVLRDDGQIAGSVSGGCVEDDLIHRLRTRELPLERPEITTYGAGGEESRRFGLPCGGTLRIVLEPLSARSRLPELLAFLEARQRVERSLDLESGAVTLCPAPASAGVACDGQTLRTPHGPEMRLLIIGAGPVARYLAAMAVMLDYQVTVCEPREEYREAWPPLEGVLLSDVMPDDKADAMRLDAHCAVVAVSHDPALDDLALIRALASPAFYIGALGSRLNNDRRRLRLREFALDAAIERLRGPAGLNLGGRGPGEIALSILAEMTAIRRHRGLDGSLADWSSSSRACRVDASA